MQLKNLLCSSCNLACLLVWGQIAHPDVNTLIAHRGESIDAPDNTLVSFQMARARGFGFECDLYLSKDGRVFSHHDSHFTRTTCGACTNQCESMIWSDISKLNISGFGTFKGTQYDGLPPPLLEEILPYLHPKHKNYIELKTGAKIVPYIQRIFENQTYATPKNVCFISFNRETCRAIKKTLPNYTVYWLAAGKISAKKVIQTLRDIGADGVDFGFDVKYTTHAFIGEIRSAGFEFHAWTIDTLDRALLAFERGAQTVTTNCAKHLADEYARR